MPSKLLLADDSVTIQRVIELTFADEDIQVIAVGDGQQAIGRIEADRPDIILADVGMPERDGYEVASFVKRTPHLAHIPVLLLTGAFEPVDESKARAAGCDGVLVKPFEPQLVISRVRDLLAGRRPGSLWAPAPSPAEPVSSAPDREAPSAAPAESLDDYFDRLDSAFAGMKAPERAAPATPETPPAAAPEPGRPGDVKPLASEAFDALDPGPLVPAAHDGLAGWDPALPDPVPSLVAPASGWSAQPGGDAPPAKPAEPFASGPPPRPASAPAPDPAPPVPSMGQPSLADAFEALLNVEQVYASRPAAVSSPPAITDEFVETVVERVVERLTTEAVRDTVVGVAERLVREEIARIKGAPR